MRYPSDHKLETHRRIVSKAAEEFRRHGFDGVGIATLMSGLQLTHGGFYAHFKDKDGLVGETCVSILEQSLAKIVSAMDAAPKGREVEAILGHYLSPRHRDNPSEGCMLPTLTSELARRPKAVRRGFTKALSAVFGRIAQVMPSDTAEGRMEQAQSLLSTMVGAVLLARAVSDPALSDALLHSASKTLSNVFSSLDQHG